MAKKAADKHNKPNKQDSFFEEPATDISSNNNIQAGNKPKNVLYIYKDNSYTRVTYQYDDPEYIEIKYN